MAGLRPKPQINHARGVNSAVDAAARAMYEMHAQGQQWSSLPEFFRDQWRELWKFGVEAHHKYTQAHHPPTNTDG